MPQLVDPFRRLRPGQSVLEGQIQPGWAVYDADDQLVGIVDEPGDASFTVRTEGPVNVVIGVAYTDIESADDGRVVLAVSGEGHDSTVDVGLPEG